jgi:DNA-binding MarR family transcriptional regulator
VASQSPGQARQPPALGGCACFNARSAARAITDLYDRTLEPCGLRTTQFAMLAAIQLRRGMTKQDLAAELGLDPSTMTRTLRPLETDGLIAVEAGASDRRVRSLTLTERGRRKVSEGHRLWHAAQARLRDELGEARFTRLVADLSEVNRILR